MGGPGAFQTQHLSLLCMSLPTSSVSCFTILRSSLSLPCFQPPMSPSISPSPTAECAVACVLTVLLQTCSQNKQTDKTKKKKQTTMKVMLWCVDTTNECVFIDLLFFGPLHSKAKRPALPLPSHTNLRCVHHPRALLPPPPHIVN